MDDERTQADPHGRRILASSNGTVTGTRSCPTLTAS
jgi:hypothetical protein